MRVSRTQPIHRFSGQLLDIVRTIRSTASMFTHRFCQATEAVEKRTVDKAQLFRIATGRVVCAIVNLLAGKIYFYITQQLSGRIERHYSVHTFHALARLDVPTFTDPVVSQQLNAVIPDRARTMAPWSAISAAVGLASLLVHIFSECIVLIGVLRHQPDRALLAGIMVFNHFLAIMSRSRSSQNRFGVSLPQSGVWAATTRDEDYLRMEGFKRVVADDKHRQEMVAIGLTDYMTSRELLFLCDISPANSWCQSIAGWSNDLGTRPKGSEC